MRLEAALAQLEQTKQDNIRLNAVVQPLQQCVTDLTADLRHKQKDLQVLKIQSAEAGGRASSKLSDMLAKLRAQEHRLQQERSAAARELAAARDLAAHDLAVLQQQLAATQASLAQLQDQHQATQGNLTVQQAATAAAEVHITDLKLHSEQLTASLSEAHRGYELVSAELEAHKAAAKTADSSLESLQMQLHASSSRCAGLQEANDDLARQVSASAAAADDKVHKLEGLRQDALAQLQQMQVAQQAAHYQHLQAADAAARAHRDKCAVRDAETRGLRWQLVRSEAGRSRLQHEAAQLHQQLAAAADKNVQLNKQLQTAVCGRTAAMMEAEETAAAKQLVERQLHATQRTLANKEEQLFGWACAAAATSIAAADVTSDAAEPIDEASGTSPPDTLLVSSLPSPGPSTHGQRSLSSVPAPVALPQLTALPQQIPATSHEDASLAPHDQVPGPAMSASHIRGAAKCCSSSSKRGIRFPNPLKPLNSVFKRLGTLCSGASSKSSSSSGTVPPSRLSSHGIADLVADQVSATAQECEHAAAAAAAAAAVTGGMSGSAGSTAIAAVPRLSRWGSAAAGAGDAGYSSPRSSDPAVTHNSIASTESQSSNAGDSITGLAVEAVTTYVSDHNDTAEDDEIVTVHLLQKSGDSKYGPVMTAAVMDAESIVSM